MFRRRSRAALFSSATALALAAFTAPVAVMAQAATYNFDIPAQDLGSALRAFGQASRQQVVFDSELVRGRTSSALVGSFSADDGIRRLLEGTGLVANRGRSGVLVISTTSNGRDRAAVPERVDDIIVTGTHIQGALPTAPVISITRADIEDAGYGNVGEVIRSLPQNFSGGQNPGVIGATAGSGVNANTSNASTINLRGLGTDATLVLVNGRRLSGDTYLQGSDISGIPLGAINRIEIVTDGSSAVYGSDAVAGVANFVLRKDYDGLELSARLGTSTQGGGEEQTYSVLAGHSRPEWYAMINIEFANQEPILASERDITALATPLTPLIRSQERTSIFASAGANFTNWLSGSIDALVTDRSSDEFSQSNRAGAPLFETTDTPAYSVGGELEFALPHGWTLRTIAGTSESENTNRGSYPTLSRTYHQTFTNKLWYVEALAEGTLFALPSGDVQAAIGAGHRDESFEYQSAVNVDVTP